MRKVCVFTGSRANYSSTRAIMKAVQKHPKLELQTIIGGAAILERYGNIEQQMEQDGFCINAKFHMIVEGESPTTMAKSTGLGIIDVAMIFNNLKPDIMVIVGDRFDVLAPTIAAAYMNIPIAHTMGGEVSGTIDESIRHAITKFAHIHFPANEDSRQRIIKLGENPDMVFNVGCPRMDLVSEIVEKRRQGHKELNQKEFFEKFKGVGETFDLEKGRFLLVSHHPVTTEFGKNRKVIEEVLFALDELKMPTIMIWPNADAGSDEISKGIRTFREKASPYWLHLFINLPFETYINLMDMCACLIGNSSSGIREGAFLGTPVVDIGSRQQQRQKGTNLLEVLADRNEIVRGIKLQLEKKSRISEAIYGSGNAGVAIADILADIPIPNVQKTIYY